MKIKSVLAFTALVFLSVLSFYAHAPAQEALSAGQKTEPSGPLAVLKSLLSTAEKADGVVLRTILTLDVENYFKLELYKMSDLGRADYLESEDYKNKQAALQKIRQETLVKTFFLEENGYKDYDLREHGFFFGVGIDFARSEREAWENAPKTIDGVLFDMFATKKRSLQTDAYIAQMISEDLLIPVSLDDARQIEKDRENTKLYIVFHVLKTKDYRFRFFDLPSRGWKETKFSNVPVASDVHLVFANLKTGVVYFEKTFSEQPRSKKK